MPVHPHVHGERGATLALDRAVIGSSPRTWGTPYRRCYPLPEIRFIPTYMGNAAPQRSHGPERPVHPHVHGERKLDTGDSARYIGSSPRTWGTRQTATSRAVAIRFIPTYMGNARQSSKMPRNWSVHPHVHGERSPWDEWMRLAVGSSPRTWGTQWMRLAVLPGSRFIPTYMGNAASWSGRRA